MILVKEPDGQKTKTPKRGIPQYLYRGGIERIVARASDLSLNADDSYHSLTGVSLSNGEEIQGGLYPRQRLEKEKNGCLP